MDISLNQTTDRQLIERIVNLPEFKNTMYADDEGYISPTIDSKNGFFIGYRDGKLACLIRAICVNKSTIEIHPRMIDPISSRELIKELYRILLTYDSFNKMVCMIPECFTKNVNFAKRLGLIDEGYIKEGYNSDNQFIGVHVMGITRNEIEAYLNG